MLPFRRLVPTYIYTGKLYWWYTLLKIYLLSSPVTRGHNETEYYPLEKQESPCLKCSSIEPLNWQMSLNHQRKCNPDGLAHSGKIKVKQGPIIRYIQLIIHISPSFLCRIGWSWSRQDQTSSMKKRVTDTAIAEPRIEIHVMLSNGSLKFLNSATSFGSLPTNMNS